MKICLFSDVHWSQYSSIVRSRGNRYSVRLEHLVESMNYMERYAEEAGCTVFICLGDFFDKPVLNSEEITALKDVVWSKYRHYFIVGNHEMASNDLFVNSANIFSIMPNSVVIDVPTLICGNILALPYVLDRNRKPLKEYYIDGVAPDIILSHNDIAGIQMGEFMSFYGFTVNEIEDFGGLFVNGHIHNATQFCSNGFNIGNLCGQNFSEDAFKYNHCFWIIDTETKSIDTVENPYSLNFYKIDFTEDSEIDTINSISSKLKHAVCTIKCKEEDAEYIKARFGEDENHLIPKNCNVVASRFLVEHNAPVGNSEIKVEELLVDHLKQFRDYVLSEIGTDEVTVAELNEVLK